MPFHKTSLWVVKVTTGGLHDKEQCSLPSCVQLSFTSTRLNRTRITYAHLIANYVKASGLWMTWLRLWKFLISMLPEQYVRVGSVGGQAPLEWKAHWKDSVGAANTSRLAALTADVNHQIYSKNVYWRLLKGDFWRGRKVGVTLSDDFLIGSSVQWGAKVVTPLDH